MDATMEQKQQYLRVNILEANYDPQDFIQFLHKHTSEDTPDINDLSLEQIQKIVQMYRKQKMPEYKSVIAQDEDEEDGQIQKQFTSPHKQADGEFQASQPNKEKMASYRNMIFSPDRMKIYEQKNSRVEYERYSPLFDYELKGVVKCIQSDKVAKVDKLQIHISDMETKNVEGFIFGFGAKTEYYYHIKSNLMKGAVKRLSEDFDWLNTTLLRLYPTLLLPELQLVNRELKDPYLRRKDQIEEYLQHLARKDFMYYSQVFVDFLTLSSDKMEKYKKSYESMGFAKGVSLVKNADGNACIELSNNSRNFYNNSRNFSKVTSRLHENISLGIAKMTQSIRVAVTDIYSVVDMFAELYDSYTELTNKYPLLRREDYSDTLVNLNNLFLGIGDNFKRTSDLLEEHLKQYYKFNFGLDKNMYKLQKYVKESEVEYLDFKYNLHKKRERVISDPTKWEVESRNIDARKMSKEELMSFILPKDSLAQSQHKSWYAYNLLNYQQEFQSYIDFVTKRYHKYFKIFAKDLLASDKSYLEALTKFLGDTRKRQND